VPQPDRNPLAATRRLLVDGTNLLHALSKTPTAAPPAALIGRLRGVIPAGTTIELVFDGPPERGLRNERIAAGVVVRYSGGRTADDVILTLIDDVRLVDGPDGTGTLLVVTDDRDLRHGARLRGARTAGSAWLLGRLEAGRLSSPSVGNARPARPARSSGASQSSRPSASGPPSQSSPGSSAAASSDGDPAKMDRPRWKSGRGATTKRGNPKKAPKTGGTGRMRP
jgi:predicted RNA-binding protein with PIN domain